MLPRKPDIDNSYEEVYNIYRYEYLSYLCELISNNPMLDSVHHIGYVPYKVYTEVKAEFIDNYHNRYTVSVDTAPNLTLYNELNGIEVSFTLNSSVDDFYDEIQTDINHYRYTNITEHARKVIHETLDRQEWNKVITRIVSIFLETSSHLPVNPKEFYDTLIQFPICNLQLKIEDRSPQYFKFRYFSPHSNKLTYGFKKGISYYDRK